MPLTYFEMRLHGLFPFGLKEALTELDQGEGRVEGTICYFATCLWSLMLKFGRLDINQASSDWEGDRLETA